MKRKLVSLMLMAAMLLALLPQISLPAQAQEIGRSSCRERV